MELVVSHIICDAGYHEGANGIPNSQLTTNFLAKYQLATNSFSFLLILASY